MFRSLVALVLISVLSTLAWECRAEEECPAPAEWFSSSGTPEPTNAEPVRGDDCSFYKWAWQTFLFVTADDGGKPRFTNYSTYQNIFGIDRNAGLLMPTDKVMALAPRLEKAEDPSKAEDIFQAGSNAILLDRNGHPIFYNIFVNPTFETFIRQNQLNDAKVLKKASPTTEIAFGSVEFKAAWQIVDEASPPTDRVIVKKAEVPWLIDAGGGKLKIDPTRKLRPVTVALIGLHVVGATKGHPEMVWATFEFDKNAPSTTGNPPAPNSGCANTGETVDQTITGTQDDFLLFSPGTTPATMNKKPLQIKVVDDAKQTFQATPAPSIVRVFPFSACSPAKDPHQAVNEIDPAVVKLNESAKGQLTDRTRKGYSLIGATWLDDPSNPNDNRGFKENRSNFEDFELGGENRLSSSSMESFTQTVSPNCFSCHHTGEKFLTPPMRLSVSHMFSRFLKETSQ